MKKTCPYHSDYNLKVFCTEEKCESYRLLCLKCTISPETKDAHKHHNFTLVKDLFKSLERVRTQKAFLANMKEKLPELDSNSNSMNTIEMKCEENNEGRLSVKEISQLLSNFRSLQKVINDPVPEKPTLVVPANSTQKSDEDSDQKVVNEPKIEGACQGKMPKALDRKKTIQPSIGIFLTERILYSKQSLNPNFVDTPTQTQQEILTVNSEKTKNRKNDPILVESSTPGSTKPNSASDASTSSGKKYVSAWEVDNNSFNFRPSTENSAQQSCDRRITRKSSTQNSSTKKKSPLSKSSTEKTTEFGIESESNQKDIQSSDRMTEERTDSSRNKRVLEKSYTVSDYSFGDHTIERAMSPIKSGISVMDQLRMAISKLDKSCLKDITNIPEVPEENISSGKKSSKRSPFVCASDVYKDNELEEEARNLIVGDLEENCSDLQQELKKQVTGFKEFSTYTQKSNSGKTKLKELKEMWKDLPKKERDQWNSIALRKRIELRDQIETQKKEKSRSSLLMSESYKRCKTAEV